jgi:ABC-2 type transport system permease protein
MMGFGKYAAIGRIAARHALLQRTAILGRAGFYGLILFVFSRLWIVVLGRDADGTYACNMLWYLALTEWVILSIPPIHLDIEREIRNGDIVYRLPRPTSYIGAQLAEGIGVLLVRAILLGITGFGFAWVIAGRLPEHPEALLLAIPIGMSAATLGMVMYCAIGMLAIWLQDVTPVYWVWQKLSFVFGGLLIPLDVYPEWVRSTAEYTPFHALLYTTGHVVLGYSTQSIIVAGLRVAFWLIMALAVLLYIYRRGLKDLSINGG